MYVSILTRLVLFNWVYSFVIYRGKTNIILYIMSIGDVLISGRGVFIPFEPGLAVHFGLVYIFSIKYINIFNIFTLMLTMKFF